MYRPPSAKAVDDDSPRRQPDQHRGGYGGPDVYKASGRGGSSGSGSRGSDSGSEEEGKEAGEPHEAGYAASLRQSRPQLASTAKAIGLARRLVPRPTAVGIADPADMALQERTPTKMENAAAGREPEPVGTPVTPSANRDLFAAIEGKEAQMCPGCTRMCRACWKFNFDPYGRFRLTWDFILLCMVFLSSVWEPYKAAYLVRGRRNGRL